MTKGLAVLMVVLAALSLLQSTGFVHGFNGESVRKDANAQTRISISPSYIAMPVGTTITVAVLIANITDLLIWQVAIEYNASIVDCTEVRIPEHNVFPSWDAPPPLINTPATSGLSFILWGNRDTSGTVDVSTGILFNINFTAMNDGETAIRIATIQDPIHPSESTDWYSYLLDHDGGEMPYIEDNGRIMVGASRVTVLANDNLWLTFDNYTGAGSVTSNETSSVQAPPLANVSGHYYEIKVTASYTDNITVSLAYDYSSMTEEQERQLQLMQYAPIPGDILPPFGVVDMKDIAYVARHFATTPPAPLWDPTADINGDGKVDMKDIGVVAKGFASTLDWVDITLHVDTANHTIYGTTNHFSIIGIHRH